MERDTAGVSPARMPQLDGLRTLAVGSVMLLHWNADSFIARHVPLLGVELFFVLSGFLITGILLKGKPTSEFILGFYIRRALRLLPLYYLVLGGLLLVSDEVRAAWNYYAFYGVNFWVAINQRWGVATHFWSLAVEEQFYFIWPLVVLLLSRRTLSLLCIVLIIAAPVFRVAMGFWGCPWQWAAMMLFPGCIDELSCGALLALTPLAQLSARRAFIGAVSGGASIIWYNWGSVPGVDPDILALPFFYILVGSAAHGISGPIGQALSHQAISYLGRISYGLYVFHLVVLKQIMPYFFEVNHYLRFIIYVSITIALSAVSWHFYETPINCTRGRVVGALMTRFQLVGRSMGRRPATSRNTTFS